MTVTPPENPARESRQLIYAALLGLAAAGMIQLSEKSDLSIPMLVEVYSFAAAIPLLAVGLVTDFARRAGVELPNWRDYIGDLGAVCSVVGLGALFFHFGPGPGIVFVGLSVLGFLVTQSRL